MTKNLLLKVAVVICAVWLGGKTSVLAQQQGYVVTGEVFTNTSDPIIGVTVVEKGAAGGGTITDSKGHFTMKVSDPRATLSLSYVGMKSSEVALAGRTHVRVTLYEDQQLLDDVVVIGYGTAKRSDLTGSVASVSKAALNDKMIANMEDALRGQVAGVRVLSNNGEPGETLNIRIRGAGSLNASNSPIYVIDGLVSETADVAPGDIESIEILKDASSTAIYGSKGSNGVVMITTKRGEAGRINVSLDMSYSIQEAANKLDLMNSYEFAQAMYWSAYNYYPKDAEGINFGQASRTFYKDSEGNFYQYNQMSKWNNPSDYKDPSNPNYVNTDWQEAMMRQVLVQEYRVNVSGGDAKNRFSVMTGYYNQPGILIHSDYDRYSLRVNYEHGFKRGGNFGVNFSGLHSEQQGLSTDGSGVTMNMLAQAPTKPLSAQDWIVEGNENRYENNNPLYQAKNIKRQSNRKNANLRVYFNVPIAKDFKLSIAGNFSNNELHNQNYYPKDVQQGRQQGGKAINTMSNAFYWNSENLLTYNPKFSNRNHRFDAMAGVIVEQTNRKELSTETHGFDLEELNTGAMQDGKTPYSISTNYTKVRMLSYLGRVNYSYKNLYFTGSIRFDGSSKFGNDNKWGVFPSGAVMWRLSEEPFLKNVEALSNLKLRFSVGSTGNASIPSLQSLSTMSSIFYPVDGSTPSYGIVTDRPANPHLKWESMIQYDAAVEFGFFRNRLSGTLEVYTKKTSDLLFERPIPYTTGYATQWSNIASVRNKGLEITLNTVPVQSNTVSWSLDYNMAFNRSRVLSLGGAQELILNPSSASRCTNFGILRVGKPLGNWYGYQSAGVWRRQSEIDALPDDYSSAGIAKSNLRPGYTRLVDQNGDGTVNEDDRIILGNSEPQFTGGMVNTLRLFNFTLTVGMEFSYGGKIFNATARELTQLNSNGGRNILRSAANYWTPTLYDMTTGEIVHQGNEDSDLKMPTNSWEEILTDRYIEDASYLRLDNISLSYTLPSALTKKFFVNKMSIFFAVRNAYVFTNYSGYDPDVSVAKGAYADMLPKLDAASFPHTRSYTMGLSLTF